MPIRCSGPVRFRWVKPAAHAALLTALLTTGTFGYAAEPEPAAHEGARPANNLPLDQVCIYASKIYSQGARVTVEGATYTCVRDERGGMRWASLFQAQQSSPKPQPQ